MSENDFVPLNDRNEIYISYILIFLKNVSFLTILKVILRSKNELFYFKSTMHNFFSIRFRVNGQYCEHWSSKNKFLTKYQGIKVINNVERLQ